MPDLTQEIGGERVRRSLTDWGAIWSGVFTFIAIWSIFGFLGYAIFAATASNAGRVAMGLSVGTAIWGIVLSIIAMYVAGRETGRRAAVTNRHDGLIHGMIMFGLSVTAVIVILAAITANTTPGAENTRFLLTDAGGWTVFLSLFLGRLAAMGGASSGVMHKAEMPNNVRGIRPAV